ncbi:YetF domain-containing protein [Paraflavisolibacter sp. H34]|uniref:DUF421 domain-containing protein n=1 Tax=Huijunlia imazamoxiresistens TaxID=3127457 RepID=UPI003018751C
MDPVLRGLSVYLFVFLIFRILGKRSLSEITTFDFVLLLIISETTTNALIGQDYSLTACFIMVCTLVGLDLVFTLIKGKWPWLEKIVDGAPLVLVDNGRPLKERMKKVKVDEEDIMEAARLNQGLERMEQIKYAVLERDGSISIIPAEKKE